MTHWIIKSKPDCPYCSMAKAMLAGKGIVFEEQRHETVSEITAFRQAGFKTFPQIFRDGHLIGGYDALQAFFSDIDDF